MAFSGVGGDILALYIYTDGQMVCGGGKIIKRKKKKKKKRDTSRESPCSFHFYSARAVYR
jgi:hypothetical protein